MIRYHLREGMRYSTLGGREIFYKEEFNFQKVAEWFKEVGMMEGVVFVVVIGRHTRIFPLKDREDGCAILFRKSGFQ